MDLPDSAEEPALRRLKTVARVMDEAVRVPGTDVRVGLDPVLSVLPGAGDVVAAGVSLYIVAEAANLGVPLTTIVRMLGNVAADVTLGAIPVVGPLFDAVIKANVWNVARVEEWVEDAASDGPGDVNDTNDAPVTIEIEEA